MNYISSFFNLSSYPSVKSVLHNWIYDDCPACSKPMYVHKDNYEISDSLIIGRCGHMIHESCRSDNICIVCKQVFSSIEQDNSPLYLIRKLLSDDMCNFIGIKPNSKLSLSEVIIEVCKYIKNNNLQDTDNKRRILLDETLAELFNSSVGHTIHYFELIGYITPHFLE